MSKSVKLVVGAAVVVAAYVGATWYVGGKVQEQIEKQVVVAQEFLNTHSSVALFDQDRSFTVSQYERGVFSSKVQYELNLKNEDIDVGLLFEDTIYHGPWPIAAGHFAPALAVAKGQLLPTEQIQEWVEATGGQAPYQGETVFGFGGHITGHGVFAATQFQDPETGAQLTTAATTLQYEAKQDQSDVLLAMQLPKIDFQEPEQQLQVEFTQLDLTGNFNTKETETYHSVMRLDTLKVNSAMVDAIELKGFQLNLDSQQHEALVDAKVHYDIEQVLAKGVDWGRVDLLVDLKNIHQALLNEISALVESEQPEDELRFQQLLGEFLSYKPELQQAKLTWANEQGESFIETRMSASPALVEYFQNGTELQQGLGQLYEELYLDISLSRPMLKQIFGEDTMMAAMFDMIFDGVIQTGTELGVVTYDNSQARTQFEFDAEKNSLLLNGQPITEEELMQLLFALQMSGLI